eukprot:667417-Hanusia_phi.AAC.1
MRQRRRTMKRQETAKVEEAEAEAEAEAEPGKEQNKSGVGHSQKMADAKMKKKFADDLELASQLLLNAARANERRGIACQGQGED